MPTASSPGRDNSLPPRKTPESSQPTEWSIEMNVDRAVLAFAGAMVLLSLVLAYYVSSYWLLFTAFVGANMLQSAPPFLASFTIVCLQDRAV